MSCHRHRPSRARINVRPLRTPDDALGLIHVLMDCPARQELIVLLARDGIPGGVSLVIDKAPDPESVLVVFDMLAPELGPGDAIAFGTIRPDGPATVGALERFIVEELADSCAAAGVRLVSWHIVDGTTAAAEVVVE